MTVLFRSQTCQTSCALITCWNSFTPAERKSLPEGLRAGLGSNLWPGRSGRCGLLGSWLTDLEHRDGQNGWLLSWSQTSCIRFPHVFPTTAWTGTELSSSCPRLVPVHSRPQEKAALPRQPQLSTRVQRSEVTHAFLTKAIIINKQWSILHHQPDAANQHHGCEWRDPLGACPLLTNHRRQLFTVFTTLDRIYDANPNPN